MFRRLIACTCAVAVVLSFGIAAAQDEPGKTESQDGVKLRFKFEKGEKLLWKAENVMSVEIEEMPEEFEGLLGEDAIDINFDMLLKLKVTEVGKNKTVFEAKFQTLKVKGNMIIQELDFEYDADDEDSMDEEDEFDDPGFGMDIQGALRDLVKEPIELTIDELGNIKVKGAEGGKMVRQFLTLNGFMGALPKEAVEEGGKWKSKSDFGIPNLPMKVKLNSANTLDEIDGKVATIKSKYTVGTGGSDDEADEGGMPFSIDAKMTGKGEGTTSFAIDAGRVIKGKHTLEVKIDATMENPATGDDMTIKAKLTMKQNSTLKTDKD